MDYSYVTASIALVIVAVCCVRCEDAVQAPVLASVINSVPGTSNKIITDSQKWAPMQHSQSDGGKVYLGDDDLNDLSMTEDDPSKRSTLLRFGKRPQAPFRFGKRGTIFRFGKRGSIFRFGKRGSIFRFGKRQDEQDGLEKRGGSIFRFGRSESSGNPFDGVEEDKRTLFRFGKRSDLESLRDYLTENGYLFSEVSADKRGVDTFHWGQEYDDM